MDSAGGIYQFMEEFNRKRYRYCRFAFRFVRNQEVADQLAADCLVRVLEHRDDIQTPTIEPYYYKTLRNTCLNYLRDRQRQCEIERQISDATYLLLDYDIALLESMEPTYIYHDDIRSIIHRELERLPATARDLFFDSRFHTLTHKELGKKYGLPQYKVNLEIQSVLKRLRIALKDYLPALLAAAAVLLL